MYYDTSKICLRMEETTYENKEIIRHHQIQFKNVGAGRPYLRPCRR